MDWEAFGRHLKDEKPERAYWVSGDDPYFVSLAGKRLREALGGDEEIEVARFTAPKEIPEALAWAKTFTLFSSHRLGIIEKAQKIDAGGRDRLKGYLADPPAFATLLFLPDMADKVVFPRWGAKTIQRVDLESDANQVARWIEAWFRKNQIRVSGPVARMLAEQAGGKFGAALPDLEKILLYVGAGGSLDRETAEKLVVDHSEEVVFRALNAVRKGRTGEAVESVEALLAQGNNESSILAMLARAVKTGWALGLPESRQKQPAEIAGAIGASPAWVSRSRRFGETIPREAAVLAWETLLEADRRLKNSAHSKPMVMLAAVEGLVRAFGA